MRRTRRALAYIRDEGEKCPNCNSDQTEGGSVETGGGVATQNMVCNNCGATWDDTYTLTNIYEIDMPQILQTKKGAVLEDCPHCSKALDIPEILSDKKGRRECNACGINLLPYMERH